MLSADEKAEIRKMARSEQVMPTALEKRVYINTLKAKANEKNVNAAAALLILCLGFDFCERLDRIAKAIEDK